MKKITIKEVSKKAGVSTATVSHVINKTRFVSPPLVKKVKEAMKKLNYQPNLLAGSLRTQKTNTIGLIVSDSSNLFFAYMQTHIEKIISKHGYSIIVANTHYSIEKEKELINILRAKRVDGILIVPENTDYKFMEKIDESGTPIVIIERELDGTVLNSVLIDNKIGSYKATEYLIKLGHENIGYLDRKGDKAHSLERKNGYLSALRKHGIKIDKDLIIRSGFSCQDGYNAANYFLENHRKVTAILTFGDFSALGAMRCIFDSGLRVPEDISVIGFTDMPICPYSYPSITTIQYPVSKIANETCQLLLKRINGHGKIKRKRIILKPKLIIRESTCNINKK